MGQNVYLMVLLLRGIDFPASSLDGTQVLPEIFVSCVKKKKTQDQKSARFLLQEDEGRVKYECKA